MPFHKCLARPARFAAVLLLAAAVGCGKGAISGTVKGPDGQPLPLGRITFSPSGAPAVGGEIVDGKYAVQNVPTGEAKVSLDTSYIKEQAELALTSSGQVHGPQPPAVVKDLSPEATAQFEKMHPDPAAAVRHAREQLAKYRAISEQYTKPNDSGLHLGVKAGENTFDVDLSGK